MCVVRCYYIVDFWSNYNFNRFAMFHTFWFYIEAAAKRQAQAEAKKEAEEKRKAAAEGKL